MAAWTSETGLPERCRDLETHAASENYELHDPNGGTTHVLNDTALAVWQLCDGRTTPAEMVEVLKEVFQTSSEQLMADLERVLIKLTAAGLIRWKSREVPG
jgi:hypothetical protein